MKNRCKQSPVEQHSFEQAFYLGCTITREWDNHGTSLANIEYRRKSIMSLIRTSRFSITSVSKWPSSVARDHEHALLPQRDLEHPSGVCEVPGFVSIEYFFICFIFRYRAWQQNVIFLVALCFQSSDGSLAIIDCEGRRCRKPSSHGM